MTRLRERKPRAPRKPRARTIAKQAWAEQVAQVDLNRSIIPADEGRQLGEPGVSVGDVQVFFRNIKERLLFTIERADFMVGCIAWLTDKDVLDAIAKLRGASVIVQKEGFLRPNTDPWCQRLRAQYDAVPRLSRSDFRGVLGEMSKGSDPAIGVRCVGNNNRDRSPAFPRAHHKFAAFFRHQTLAESAIEHSPVARDFRPNGDPVVPLGVWTGSFNWTRNANQSLENVVFLSNPLVVDAYTWEFQQIAALSEPLDWESDWMAPEWRIGT